MRPIAQVTTAFAIQFYLLATSLPAQSRSVSGVVLDQSSKPLKDVTVYLEGRRAVAFTGKDGRFSIAGEGTELTLVARLPGYVPVIVELPPGTDAVDVGTVSLRKIDDNNDRFAVRTVDLKLHPQLASFYERQRVRNSGIFLAPDDVARHRSGKFIEVVRRIGGMHRMCFATRQGSLDCGRIADRGPTSINNGPAPETTCAVALWFHGVGPSGPLADEIRMDEVLAVEAYERPGSAPAEFQGRDCGIVVLWMRPTTQ